MAASYPRTAACALRCLGTGTIVTPTICPLPAMSPLASRCWPKRTSNLSVSPALARFSQPRQRVVPSRVRPSNPRLRKHVNESRSLTWCVAHLVISLRAGDGVVQLQTQHPEQHNRICRPAAGVVLP